MRYHALIPFSAAIACLALAILVYRGGPRRDLARSFAFLALSLVLWNLNFFVLFFVKDYALALELTSVFRIGAFFVPPSVLRLTVVLREDRGGSFWWRVLWGDYALAAFFVALNASGVFVAELRHYDFGFYSVGSWAYDLFSLFVFVNFLAAFGLMIHDYHTSSNPRMRQQLRFWLLGMIVALPLGLTNLLPAYGVPVYPLGNLGSAVWAGIVGYAIVRHRLMDIEIVVTKGIAYIGAILLLVGPVFAATLVMQRWAFGDVHYDFSAGLAVMLIGVGVLFPTLRATVESRLSRSLFRQKFQTREALSSLAGDVVRILDRDTLVQVLCDSVSESLSTSRCALLLLDAFGSKFEVRQVRGPMAGQCDLGTDHPFVRWLLQRGEPVLREEAEALRRLVDKPRIVSVFSENEWEVCVPLISGKRLIGLLGLGRRRDLEVFAAGDLEILGRLASGAAIALENARLYDEVRRSRDIIHRAGRLSALGTLAAGIAHEIRNPLVSVRTFFQLAPQRLSDAEFMSSFMRLAEEEVERINSLITELLTYAKSTTASLRLIDLDELVDRTVTLLAPQAKTQRVELVRVPPGRASLVIVADGDQIVQVLVNIVLNAIQATPGGGTVTVETLAVEYEGGLFCQVEVRDTGQGIPPEIREEIFNPFFTTKDKGTGLGLAISHQIVAEAGGFIAVDSVEGRGSRFCINLPAAAIPQDEETAVAN